MKNFFKSFKSDETGAVTVDWVVLTATLVGLGVAVIGAVKTEAEGTATSVSNKVASYKLN